MPDTNNFSLPLILLYSHVLYLSACSAIQVCCFEDCQNIHNDKTTHIHKQQCSWQLSEVCALYLKSTQNLNWSFVVFGPCLFKIYSLALPGSNPKILTTHPALHLFIQSNAFYNDKALKHTNKVLLKNVSNNAYMTWRQKAILFFRWVVSCNAGCHIEIAWPAEDCSLLSWYLNFGCRKNWQWVTNVCE